MAVTENIYPVTGDAGSYQNIFPSQVPIYWNFTRVDAVISSIVSGTDSKVRMAIVGTFSDVQVGQFVTWSTDAYGIRSSRVLTIVDASTIEVDQVFISTNVTNGYCNYHRNYFLEIRYVLKDSISDDQDALLLIDDFSQVPNSPDGVINANISAPAQLLTPDFDIQIGEMPGLFIEYKVQYRESYEGNRSGSWSSPSVDIPIMLVHGSDEIEVNNFTDSVDLKKYTRFYPLIYSFIYSDINDQGANSITIKYTEYGVDKSLIAETDLVTLVDFNGVYLIVLDTNTLDGDTVFVDFSADVSSSTAQYDPSQYDPGQYA